jgi:hypothetical protein
MSYTHKTIVLIAHHFLQVLIIKTLRLYCVLHYSRTQKLRMIQPNFLHVMNLFCDTIFLKKRLLLLTQNLAYMVRRSRRSEQGLHWFFYEKKSSFIG